MPIWSSSRRPIAFLRDGLKLDNREIGSIFERWNGGVLAGYLMEITAKIFRKADPEGEGLLLDRILDAPGQKGTGRWTGVAALETATPAPTIADAVFQRFLNADVELRRRGADLLPGEGVALPRKEESAAAVANLESALYAAKICAYAQGFALLKAAEREFRWPLNYGSIALLWRGGCIIRARFLNDINALTGGIRRWRTCFSTNFSVMSLLRICRDSGAALRRERWRACRCRRWRERSPITTAAGRSGRRAI